jgi:4-amino-4-deoxy-L-arabinose transferase-like glycosyltransferase
MKRWVGPGIFLILLAVTIVCLGSAASSTGVAIGESAHMDAAKAIGGWFNQIGLGQTSFFEQRARDAAWSPVHSHATLPTLLSAFVWHIATSGYAWWSELLSLRLGYVLITAFSVPLLFALVAPVWGRRPALLACAFLALVPRAMHQAALAEPQAVTVTGWLLVLVCYARARRAQRRLGSLVWSLATGLALGLAVAISHGALVVLVALVVHTLWTERHALRPMLREGLLPLPATLLSSVMLAPVVFYFGTPWLWHDAAARGRPMFISAFSASPGADAYTWSFGALSVLSSVPAVTLFAAALGLAVVVGPRRLRSWACDEQTWDRGGGALVVVGLAVAVAWPWLTPASMHASPPGWLPTLPFVAALAGVGMDRTLRELSSRVRNRPLALRLAVSLGVGALCLAAPLWQTLRQSTTRSAAFTPLSGGPAWVARRHEQPPLHDGSPTIAFASTIDSLGRSTLSVYSPEVPFEVWMGMKHRGILRTTLRAAKSPAQADLVLVGAGDDALGQASKAGRVPKRLATVQRDGVVLLSLYEMSRR